MAREKRTRERLFELPIAGIFQLDVPSSSSDAIKITDYLDPKTNGFIVVFRANIYFTTLSFTDLVAQANVRLSSKTTRNLATNGQVEFFIPADLDIWIRAKGSSAIVEGVDIKRMVQNELC